MNKKTAHIIFQRFSQHNTQPTTELIYHSTFELLIAVMLSAHTTDKAVNRASQPLFAVANTPEKILQLGEQSLKAYIKSIGLYNNKAKNIIKTCEILLSQHQTQVPNSRKALEALPGVGHKTASVILNTAFGQPAMAVDTHIFRVSNRTGMAPGKTLLAVEKALLAIVPKQYQLHAHHWLLLHGRYTCMARKPLCSTCLITDLCQYPAKKI